jgi:hypothetical protein
MRHLSLLLSFVLIPVLVSAPLSAQLAERTDATGDAAVSRDLQIRMAAGDPGRAEINSKATAGFTVEVTSPDGLPVRDAAVALRLPDVDPTGVFPDGSHSSVGYTDDSGHVHFAAIKWGGTPGLAALRVTAVKGTSHAGILVDETLLPVSVPATPSQPPSGVPASALAEPLAQPIEKISAPGSRLAPVATLKPEPSVSVTNSAPLQSKPHSHTKWIVIAAIAAGAGAGLAFAGKGKSAASVSPPPSLSIGPPSVSVGHP